MKNKESRIEELEGLVRYHANLYYNESKSEITDAEYDVLVDELKMLDPENTVIAEVGASPTYGKKTKHPSVMGSLDKETTIEGVNEWHKKYGRNVKVGVMPKIDGNSLRLRYENGRLVEAASRGDGFIGQDVLDNVKAMKSVPKYEAGLTAEVRLEVYMRKSVFERLNRSGMKGFKNPRNAASGSLMAKDPAITGSRDLDVFVHDVMPDNMVFETESAKRTWMEINMPSFKFVDLTMIDIKDFKSQALSWEVLRPSLDYQIDGLVIALDSIADQEEAGWNGKRPRGKLAYKFASEQAVSRVLVLDRQVGRTGRLTPMARITPTLVDGSTISNITIHNEDILEALDICVGDEVLIQKDGDVIPGIVRVSKKTAGRSRLIPLACPSCGGRLERPEVIEKGEKINGPSYWCNNSMCPAQLERRILHYVKTVEIMGVGAGIVSGLCQAGYVKSISDLYYLKPEQVKAVTGGDRASEKVLEAIMEKNEIPLAVFLDALGIDGLGTTTAKEVAKKFKTLKGVSRVSVGDLENIEGIGELTATKIIEGLELMSLEICELSAVVDVVDIVESTGNLKGKSFCLTGAMSKPRKDIEKAIEAAGGEIKSSVGKGLSFLVQADASSTSSKTEKAAKCGTKVISEDELWRMMK